MLAVIRGAGDIATGIALRLHRARVQVVMTDLAVPTSIRRTVCFSEAIRQGSTTIEGITGELVSSVRQIEQVWQRGHIPVLIDPEASCVAELNPQVVVDAILAKRNLGTKITDAPVVIGVGPGFLVGTDCHAAVETMRGHYLGRVIWEGSPLENTNVPGLIGGFAGERVLRAPTDGCFHPRLRIGAKVRAGEVAGEVDGEPMFCTIDGILRGILAENVPVRKGMKSGDIDPRCEEDHCFCVSDKALAVGGGALEAILQLTGILEDK